MRTRCNISIQTLHNSNSFSSSSSNWLVSNILYTMPCVVVDGCYLPDAVDGPNADRNLIIVANNPQFQMQQQQQQQQHIMAQQRQAQVARQAMMAQQYSGMPMGMNPNAMGQMTQAQFQAMRGQNPMGVARPVNLPQHLQQQQQQAQHSLEQQQQQQQAHAQAQHQVRLCVWFT